MHRWLILAAFLLLSAAPPPASAEEPDTAPLVRRVRPSEGSLRRGVFPLPGWAVLGSAAVLATIAGGVLLARVRER